MNETRVMMLLLDGAPFNAFFSLAKKGVLPNLQKLMKKGCFNLLNSTIPPTSPVAIPSLLTGMNPGKHGRFGWGYLQNGIYKPTPPLQNLGGNTLWDVLGVANKKVILFNVPLTYPPIKVNGILISGPPTPRNKAYSYPPEIISTLKAKIGQYYVDMNIKGNDFQGDSEDAFIEKAYLVTRTRAQTMQYLMDNYDWTLFVGVFTTIDRLQHVFYGYFDEESPIFNIEKKKILIQYYQEIDQILGKIISSLDENTILFIVSDHGFEHLSTRVGLNNILVQKGFIQERSKLQFFTIENLVTFLQKIGLGDIDQKLPRRILNATHKVVPRKTKYSESKCFGYGGTIFINESYFNDLHTMESFKKQLTDTFYSITEENTENKIVEKVFDRTELYHGSQIRNAPHLIIRLKTGYSLRDWTKTTFQPIKLINNKTVKTGTHHSLFARKGIFIASGKGIKEGYHIEADIVDIVPTILHVLGIPILPAMDGQVLKQIFEPKSRFNIQPVKVQEQLRQESYREKTKARIRNIRHYLNK